MTGSLSLTLVRHGETEWMDRGLLHGSMDSPLTSLGRRHAELAARRLQDQHFDALYSSPLGRTMETAAILGQAVGLQPDPLDGLREMHFGWLEGTPRVLWEGGGILGQALRPLRAAMMLASAERPGRLRRRVTRMIETLEDRHPQGRLLLVGHWGVFSRLLGVMLNAPRRTWRQFGPWTACAITEVRRIPGAGDGRLPRWEIVRFNDESHLQEEFLA
jgi:broad specificity phosphatase PhoE